MKVFQRFYEHCIHYLSFGRDLFTDHGIWDIELWGEEGFAEANRDGDYGEP